METQSSPRSIALGLLGYVGLLVLGVAVVLGVLQLGHAWGFVVAASGAMPAKPTLNMDVVLHVLGTLATVIFLGSVLGRLCKYIGQPPVIGEVIAGLSLGPSLLGAISPDMMHLLIPSPALDPKNAVATSLKVIAQLGVVLYMFLVGLELNAMKLKHKAHAAVAISHASIVVPFALGTVLSLWLYPMLSDRSVPFVSFSLFLGVAMSITAFPVLARILTDRNLQNTPVGTVALSCAAADDVTAWCLLSLVVGVAKAEVGNAYRVIGGAVAFIAFMFFAARPILVRTINLLDQSKAGVSKGDLPPYAIASIYVLILSAAAMTEWIGIHAIFGAFLLGVVIPSESLIAQSFQSKLKEPVTVLLLPAFFAYTGMRTEIGLLNDWASGMCAL